MSSRAESIGLLTWDYLQPKGGMGRAMQWIASALGAAHMNVIVASPSSMTPLLSFTQRIGGHLLFSLLLPFTCARWLASHPVSAVLLPIGPGGVFLIRKPKIQTIGIVYHTYDQQARLVPGQWWKRIFIPLERRTMRQCSAILCFCDDTKRTLINRYHIPVDRIVSLSHGIDTDAWTPRMKSPRSIVCVSRLDARKGVDVLLNAWPAVYQAVPEATLTIVGRGSLDVHGPSVTHHQSLSFDDLTSLVGSSAVAVCPSYLEGYGCACAEAMSASCAVVASDTDGLRSLISHDDTGMLVQPGDASALASAIIQLLKDDQRAKAIGERARGFIAHHADMQRASRELAATINHLVTRLRSAPPR